MGTYRMYTGDDGEAHWEEIELDNTPEWTSNMATSSKSVQLPSRSSIPLATRRAPFVYW